VLENRSLDKPGLVISLPIPVSFHGAGKKKGRGIATA
jgi:hypothetical protein